MGIDMSQIRTASQTQAKPNPKLAVLAAAMIVAVFGAVVFIVVARALTGRRAY